MAHHDITTVIVNWNTSELLDGALRNLVENPASACTNEVIVVDNDSSDDSMEMMAQRWPSIRVIQMGENAGFCRANNAAIRASDSDYVLLINTDGRLRPGTLDTMLGYMEADPLCAVVGPRLEYGDGSFQRWTGGELPGLRSVANFSFGLDRLANRKPSFTGVYASHDSTTPRRCGWVSSAVMLLRRSALDDFGPLDEAIFLYMDDVDLCRRASDAGWNTWYAADTTAVHFMSASSRKELGAVSPETIRSAIRWYARQNAGLETTVFRAILAAGFGVRGTVYRMKAVLGGDADAGTMAEAHWKMAKLSLERVDA